ncbi:MAG: hypothetical protein R3D00_00455 [Bacteroidia bacterium]
MQLGRVDEPGSGVLNVHRFIKAYSGNGQPQFFEGPTFKMMIPIPETHSYRFPAESNDIVQESAIDGAIDGSFDGSFDGITQNLKNKLKLLLKTITLNEGKHYLTLSLKSKLWPSG